MANLLKETLEILEQYKRTEQDVRWVGNSTHKSTWDEFKRVADTEYDHGFGGQEVAQDLLIVGEDFWLERHEYDGSEWWEFKQTPKEPENTLALKALTINQANRQGRDLYSVESLLAINGVVWPEKDSLSP